MHPRLNLEPILARRATLGLIAVLCPATALGQDKFEIQVYDSQIDPILVPRVELHLNYFPSGIRQGSEDGELPTHQVARYTLEPQTGLSDWCEIGGYFQTALRPEGTFDFAGVKLRFKARFGRLWSLVGLALNTELSYVPRGYEAAVWGGELRPIADLRLGRLYLSVNPILAIDFAGRYAGSPQLQPAAKLSVDLLWGLALGTEYYAGFGPIDGPFPAREQTHVLYGALDWTSSVFELNFGVGYGGWGAGERWVTKAIIGLTWERPASARE